MAWISVNRWRYYRILRTWIWIQVLGVLSSNTRVKFDFELKPQGTQILEMTEITECQKQPLQKPQVSKNCQDFVMLNAGTNNPFHQLLILGCYQPVVVLWTCTLFSFEEATKDFTRMRENPCASLKISFYREMICLKRKYCKIFVRLYRNVRNDCLT